MRVDVNPRHADLVPGQPQVVTITITNTATVIGGYVLRVLGADPGWVRLETSDLSLFPDEVRTITATITPPPSIPAGTRRVAIQVRELTPPHDSSITELDLTVPASRAVSLRVDPLTVTGGRSAGFSVIAENTGNTVVTGLLDGSDPEGHVEFDFDPARVDLAPGEHAVIDLRARARRRLMGTPVARTLGLYLDESDEPFFATPEPDPEQQKARDERAALAHATFIQRPVLSRGAISLLGLLLTVSVFAIVITIALSRLVGQSTADRNLALQVAEARNAGSGVGTSGIAGTVRLLTTKAPEPGVSVSVYSASDTSTPIATTATNKQGGYAFGQLPAGGYKLSFRGAGFVQVWYPAAATDADASTVTVAPGQQKTGVDVTLGGVPATISGTVTGDDVSAATLYLETLPTGVSPADARAAPLGIAAPANPGNPVNPLPGDGGAIVQTVPIGSDGTFTLTNVPSPSVYQLVVTKVGYATSTQQIDVGAGEDRTGIEIDLLQGDGLISGTVNSTSGPLGGVTLTATTGQQTVSTVSLTSAPIGTFTLRNLPTPGTYTVVAQVNGYSTQTMTLTLAAGEKLTGVAVSLSRSSGSLHGTVTTANGAGAGDVSVTVTDGLHTVQTETESTGSVGAWTVGGLPVPGTYTITFARADLASQTVSVSLDSAGDVTPGSQSAQLDATGSLAVRMQSSTAVVYGTVTQPGGTQNCAGTTRLGEASVTLNSGAQSYVVTTASVPAAECGDYRVEDLPPGTYTLTVAAGSGTTPASVVFTLRAGDVAQHDVTLSRPASIAGTVKVCDSSGHNCTAAPTGWTVFLYPDADFANPEGFVQETKTGADGAFAFSGVDAGDYVVAVSEGGVPDSLAGTGNVTVRPSAQSTAVVYVDQS
ncbi:MAG TPA: carboxypeptidase regulatory-like domain-containing protein [Jatrophihabitans sp.]|nr:carboxypeptidase regulatory-like domain-containing protein [Jatrophihabitans sp.]